MIEINNLSLLKDIRKLARKIPDTPVDTLEDMILVRNGETRLLTYLEEGVLRGYSFSTLETFDGEDSVYIQSFYISSLAKNKRVGKEFVELNKKWAREKRLKSIYLITQRNPKAIRRKYKFNNEGAVMKLEV